MCQEIPTVEYPTGAIGKWHFPSLCIVSNLQCLDRNAECFCPFYHFTHELGSIRALVRMYEERFVFVVNGGFLGFLLYQWIIDPNGLYGIGISNTNSVIYMLAMYLLALAIYLGFRAYRKREGIDIDKIYEEIPVE